MWVAWVKLKEKLSFLFSGLGLELAVLAINAELRKEVLKIVINKVILYKDQNASFSCEKTAIQQLDIFLFFQT